MRATYSASTLGMHHIFSSQGLSCSSPSRRRMVSSDTESCTVNRTISSASSCIVHRARPLGGAEHATATSKDSSLASSFRSAPGRGASLSARSSPSSTKRCFVRYTVEVPTATFLAISASAEPASAASKICARFSRRYAPLPPSIMPTSCARSDAVNVTRYLTFMMAPSRSL